jgi:thiol-disulfide isomerase/thioredoxin
VPGLPAPSLLLAARLSLLLLAGCATTPSAGPPGAGGGFLAPLALPAVGQGPFLPSRLAGQVVLVHFFATWCFPCLQEVTALLELQRRYGERGFTVVAVGMDLEGERVVEPFVRAFEPTYPVLLADERLRAGDTAYGRIRELPTNVLVGPKGQVLAAWSGLASPEQVGALIEKALPGP